MLRRSAKIGAMIRFIGWVIASRGGAVRALILHRPDGKVVPGDVKLDEEPTRGKGFSAEPSLSVELKRSGGQQSTQEKVGVDVRHLYRHSEDEF